MIFYYFLKLLIYNKSFQYSYIYINKILKNSFKHNFRFSKRNFEKKYLKKFRKKEFIKKFEFEKYNSKT